MLNALHFRPLLLSDANSLAAIHHDAFPKSWPREAFTSLLKAPTALGLLATQEQTAVGFILAQAFSDEAEILTFAVLPSYQRQGIGTRLFSTLLSQLKAQGIKSLFLEVSVLNATALALYEKHNFQPIAQRVNYFPHLSNATALVLRCVL